MRYIALFFLCLLIHPVQAEDRPNIIFAIADDWGWPHAGAYGDKVVRTPAFDSIARKGILFNHGYISSPSCTPSRNAILSGQHFFRLKEGANLWSAFPAYPAYPRLLKDAGYFVGYKPKGWGPGRPGKSWGGKDPLVKRYRNFETFIIEKPADKPFCYWAGSSDPHRGYKQGAGGEMRNEAGTLVPPFFPDTPKVRADINDYYFEVNRFDTYIGSILKLLEDKGLSENTLVFMTGDHGWPFPRGKCNLYDHGARVPLAIQWPAKVKPGRVVDDFVSMTDIAPTFLESAGVKIPEVMTGRSLMNVLVSDKSGRVDEERGAVICGRERHTPAHPAPEDGYPMRSIRTHDYLYIRNFFPDRWPVGGPEKSFRDCDGGPTKSVILGGRETPEMKKQFELCFGKRPAEELYVVKNDPYQLTNVAGNPEYAQVKKELADRLMSVLKGAQDPRVVGGEEVLARGQYLGRGGRKKKPKPKKK